MQLSGEINIVLAGDIALNGMLSAHPELNENRFKELAGFLQGNALVFANLEMPIETDERNKNKSHFHYAGKKVTRDVLQMLNICCVSLANNHIYDCKMSGLTATIQILDELNIKYTGAGWKKEQLDPVILEKNGYRIGFMAFVDPGTNPKTERYPEFFLNLLDMRKIRDDIKKVRYLTDTIICSLHWGMDYSNFFSREQQRFAREIINYGADIVMGHHPHTIQPVEKYKDKYIFYSLGGICFGDFLRDGKLTAIKRKTKLGMLAIFDYRAVLLKIIPTRDLPGNEIIIPNKNLAPFLKRLLWINILKNKYKVIAILAGFKEAYMDRMYEFFWGYYRNPFYHILRRKSFNKIGYMFRDFRRSVR